MPKSYYKGARLGSVPACAICGGPGRGGRSQFHLPGGVTVWLCADHRADEFVTGRAGRDFFVSLMHVWDAAGCLTARRRRALEVHRRRIGGPPPDRPRPGSYAWAALRAEAERAFAAGESPALVIDRLRRRHARGDVRPPSVRTMRRWFSEGRWLSG